MSNYLRVSNTENRNLHDLRVNCRTNPANVLITGSTPVKVLDFPNITFDDNIFPGSPCPRQNLIGMPSPHLYEVDIQDVLKKSIINGGEQEEQPADVELDPLLEDSVDINELLNNANQINEEDLEKLIFDQNQTIDLPGGFTTTGLVTVNNESAVAPTALSELDFMTNPTELQTSTSGWQVVTIKAEDIGTNTCAQLPSPVDSQVSSTTIQSPGPLTPPVSPAPPTPQRGRPGRKPSGNGPARPSRKRPLEKDSEEYRDKRQRNNVAVRKSRDKAKLKQVETERRVQELVTENEGLQKKVELLSKELQVLKSLFINVGAALPANFEKLLSK